MVVEVYDVMYKGTLKWKIEDDKGRHPHHSYIPVLRPKAVMHDSQSPALGSASYTEGQDLDKTCDPDGFCGLFMTALL
jgi:hypothetical protein